MSGGMQYGKLTPNEKKALKMNTSDMNAVAKKLGMSVGGAKAVVMSACRKMHTENLQTAIMRAGRAGQL